MNRAHARHAVTVVLAVLLSAGTAGCGSPDDDGDQKAAAKPTALSTPVPTPSPADTRSEQQKAWDETMAQNEANLENMERRAAAASADPASTKTATLPDMVGMNVYAAKELAEVFDFRYFVDQDATGQGRAQVSSREWTVCSQDPGPGVERVEVLVTLQVVKVGEWCP